MIAITNGKVTRTICSEAAWLRLADADLQEQLRSLVDDGCHRSATELQSIEIPEQLKFLEHVRAFARSVGDEPVAIISKASKLDTISSLERAARREMLRESLQESLQEGKVRAPVGYTRTSPLVVNGRSYVGGQFIPGATAAEVSRAVEKQAARDEQSQSQTVLANRRARAIARVNALIPQGSADMFPSTLFMPIDATIAARRGELNQVIMQAQPTVLRTANLTQNDFLAGREDLSRRILVDRINLGSDGEAPAMVIKNNDKSYTILSGHQRIIAGLMTGEPTIPAKVIQRADVDAHLNAIDERQRARTAPPPQSVVQAPAPSPAAPAAQATHSMGTFGHSPTAVGAWMGVNGWSTHDARRVLRARGVTSIRDSTFSTLLSRGRNGIGIVAPLTEAQGAELNAMRSGHLVAPQSVSGIVAPARPSQEARQQLAAERASRQAAAATTSAIPVPPVQTNSARDFVRRNEQPMQSIKRLRSEYKAYRANNLSPPNEWENDWHQAKNRALLLPENLRDQSQARTVEKSRRTAAEHLEATQGASAAKRAVQQIKDMDVASMAPLERPDRTQWRRVTIDRNANAFMQEHGAACSGAPPGCTIEVGPTTSYNATHDQTIVTVHGPHDLTMSRSIYTPKPGSNAKGFAKNHLFTIKESAPDGLGAQAFTSQVAELQAHGFEKIKVGAAGEGNHIDGSNPGLMNGYYTWPRFGYTGSIPMNIEEGHYGLPFKMRDVESVQELMTTKEGRDWWRKNGTGGSYVFDLDPNSYSSKHLVNYFNNERRS